MYVTRFLHDNAKGCTVPVQVESIFVNASLNSTYQSRQQLQLTSCTNQDLLQETNLNDSNEDNLANYHEVQDNYNHVGFHEKTAVMSSTVADKYKIMCSKSNNESIVASPCLDQKTCITNTTNASSTEDNNSDKPVPLPPKSVQSRKLCTKKGTSTSSVTSVYQHSGEHSESLRLIEKRKFVQHSQPPIQPIRLVLSFTIYNNFSVVAMQLLYTFNILGLMQVQKTNLKWKTQHFKLVLPVLPY